MLKGFIGLLLLVFLSLPATAAPQHSDDRYFNPHAYGQSAKKQVHAKQPAPRRVARSAPKVKAAAVERRVKYRRTIWQGAVGEVRQAIRTAAPSENTVVHGGRPAGCPARAWCGCWLAKHLGLDRRDLWLARNWARVGVPSGPQPGAIAVWRHHVGKVVAVAPGRVRLLSGNDGRAVRERWRSARDVIAYRLL